MHYTKSTNTFPPLSPHRESLANFWSAFQYCPKDSLSQQTTQQVDCEYSIIVQTASLGLGSSHSRTISEANIPICPLAHPSSHASMSASQAFQPSGKKPVTLVFSFQTNNIPTNLVFSLDSLVEGGSLFKGELLARKALITHFPEVLRKSSSLGEGFPVSLEHVGTQDPFLPPT